MATRRRKDDPDLERTDMRHEPSKEKHENFSEGYVAPPPPKEDPPPAQDKKGNGESSDE